MILLIDNYDSFSYNLYQCIGAIEPDIKVIRNDEQTIEEIAKLSPTHIILSPGPGRPSEAGICEEVVRFFFRRVPILGVCLGHQAICEAFGATITYANKLMHGKQSEVVLNTEEHLFTKLPDRIMAARYHSLKVAEEGFPKDLKVIARTLDDEIMAVRHKKYPVYGLQFHPESILTPKGNVILKNFLQA